MGRESLTKLEEYLISIIGDSRSLSGKETYEKVRCDYPDVLPSVIWSRLMWLVQSGYLEIVSSDDDQYVTMFKVSD